MKEFKVKFCLADSEYLTALRLVTGAICTVHEIDVDTLEDFKVCVTESALILKNNGFESAAVTFEGGEGVSVTVSGEGGSPRDADNELSLALISALVEECDIDKCGNVIRKVTLKI